jgi:phage replication-related protein YjqB (UPF0714/DUF867 family)
MTDYRDAWRTDGTAETLWENPDDRIVVLAPHGGDIETGTDDAAASVHKRLRAAGVEPTTWMYHGFGPDAFDEYHVSSNRITGERFEKLDAIGDRRFDYAVSVHMQVEDYVAVGGRIDRAVRRDVADALRERLPTGMEVRWRHDEMKYEGSAPSNVVNWLTKTGDDGLQLELTPVTAYRFWEYVARAVADVYADLL